MRPWLVAFALFLVAPVLALLPRAGVAAPLSKADQLCVVASHKAAAKVLSMVHKEGFGCLKMGTKNRLPSGVGMR